MMHRGMKITKIKSNERRLKAVSYTHLDVYKRQALNTSKNLGQLLSNMQDGMRAYFDELSRIKDFIGIQKVLIQEINNSDRRRYAILTTCLLYTSRCV